MPISKNAVRRTIHLGPDVYKSLNEESQKLSISVTALLNYIIAKYYGITNEKTNYNCGGKKDGNIDNS